MLAVPYSRGLLMRSCGFTVLELLLTLAVSVTMTAIALPLTGAALDELRTGMAARYLAARIGDARLHAVSRSARMALRFDPLDGDYGFTEYRDGNGNGVRTVDITAGIDPEVSSRRFLRDSFSGVMFGLRAGVPDVDGARMINATDGVRLGTARILTLGPDGTATSGTLYLHGRGSQYAVRILGATGRTRVLRFDPGAQQWTSR
jgi:hypothetical protein